MEVPDICYNCFSQRGSYDVCPWCGFVAGTPNKPDYLLQPGIRLWGRYIIGTVLGIGGFGVTYKAWDTRLAAPVAIKEFFPQNLASRMPGETRLRAFSGSNTEAYHLHLARFMDEAKNLARFAGDAHIVSVLDYFEDNGTAYIIMEYLEGETLKQHLAAKGGALPPKEAAAIMEALLAALASIHAKGVIHRDISPDNLFVLRGGSVKVLDFGAARFAVREEWTQSVVVKKGYAPPEQYRGNMKQGVWTDIYAAGATWYKMLTGQTPEESIERWEKDGLRRPSRAGAPVEDAVDKAVMKAMALRPELRFKSAEAMLAALHGEGHTEFPEEELKKRRRVRALSVVLAVVAVAAALVIAGWQLSHGQAPAIVTTGPTLADMNIAPDTITLLVSHSDPEHDPAYTMYNELAAAFMEAYPEHKVIVDKRHYDDLEASPPDFSQPGAPTVFPPYYGNARDYLANLAPLLNGLDAADYYLMDMIETRHRNEDGAVNNIPIGFLCDAAWGSPAKAAAGVTLPESFTSFSQILDVLVPAYSGMNFDAYNALDFMTWFEPEGYRQNVYAPEVWQADFRRYVELRAQQLDPENDVYVEQYFDIMQLPQSNLDDMYHWMGSDAFFIPILKDGQMQGFLTENFSVNSTATENQQHVGMLFIHFLLSERGQNILHVQHDQYFPLNRKAMQQFLAAYPEYTVLEPYFEELNSSGRMPRGLEDQLRELLDYNVSKVDVEGIMRLFMEYQPTEED